MNDDRNRSQIIRIDARNCFVESLNDAFEIGKAHFTFASYDLSKPSGQRQTNSIQIYIDMAEVLELCRKLVGGELRYTAAFLPEYPEKSKRGSTISCCWLNGGWDYSGVYAEELRMKNGCVYRGCALLSNEADDVETVHAIKTIEDCLWKQYPQY